MDRDDRETLTRVQRENRVLAELATLVGSEHDYADLIAGCMDLIERLVSSPLLALSLRETGQVGHYLRIHEETDSDWSEAIAPQIIELHEQRLTEAAAGRRRSTWQTLATPPAWLALFPGQSRSGRSGILTLACPRPLAVTATEEELMLRLVRQTLVVLDHALLLQELEEQELVDSLTGVANHRRLLETLEYELRRHAYHHRPLALVMVDVQGLDRINQSFGRRYGNHVLRTVADLIQRTVRPIDSVARCGLDEFAVLLPESDELAAESLVESILARFLNMEFAGGAVALSVAGTHCRPDESLTAERFLQRAEQALRETKRQEQGWNSALGARLQTAR